MGRQGCKKHYITTKIKEFLEFLFRNNNSHHCCCHVFFRLPSGLRSFNLQYRSTVWLYVGYEDGNLITNINSFEIPDYDDQEINISVLKYKVKSNEEITLHISKITDDLLEVKYLCETDYKKRTIPVIPTFIASIVLVIPMLGLCTFMLVVTNIKNPSKRIRKIQKQFLLNTYNKNN